MSFFFIRCLIGCAVSYQLNTRHFGAFYAIRSKTASLASARISIQRSRRFTLVLRKIHPKLLPFVPIKQRIIRNDGANNYYNCFLGTNKLSKKLGRISRLSFFFIRCLIGCAVSYQLNTRHFGAFYAIRSVSIGCARLTDGRARIHPAKASFCRYSTGASFDTKP